MKRIVKVTLMIVTCFWLSVMIQLFSPSNFLNTLLFASDGSGTTTCDCDQEGGGTVGPYCTDYYFQDGNLVFVCCSSEGAFYVEFCNCSVECNTPYNPNPCDIQN